MISDDIDQASEFLEVLVQPEESAKTVVLGESPNLIKLWFWEWDINSFAHEAMHATDYVMNMSGVENLEARAYYIGFVMEQLYIHLT